MVKGGAWIPDKDGMSTSSTDKARAAVIGSAGLLQPRRRLGDVEAAAAQPSR